MTHAQAALIHEVREWLQTARHTVLFTGAGMSAESGIQTFRDALTGLWSQFNPMDLATPGAFERQPELVLSWYAGRRAQALSCQPHAGYEAIMEIAGAKQITVITQNVDGVMTH